LDIQPLLFGQTAAIEPTLLFARMSFGEPSQVLFSARPLAEMVDAPPPQSSAHTQEQARTMRPMSPLFSVSFPDRNEMLQPFMTMRIPVDLRNR
jgi:hypothetical protein